MDGSQGGTQTDFSWPWPFSQGDLTAGLRRYLQEPTLHVTEVRPTTIARRRPSIGVIRGMNVKYQTESGQEVIQLVVKEPRGTTRTGLAGAGRREVGVYLSLAGQLPLTCPALIASSTNGDWLLLEAVPPHRDASLWEAEDYYAAIESLVQLHDRFWGLGEDLKAFSWLSRPLTSDFDVHVAAAEHAIQQVHSLGEPEALAAKPTRMKILSKLSAQAKQVIAPLQDQINTFLHGDYWPGNISVLRDGSQVVYDWQLTAIGPAVLDLLVFVKKSSWWFDPLPIPEAEIVRYYRERLAACVGQVWDEETWDTLWDHALLWRFMQEWLDLVTASPDPVLMTRTEQLDQVWLEPVMEAVNHRLGGM